jgi:hypothetical protein
MAKMPMSNAQIIMHSESLQFNSNGKYIFSTRPNILFARATAGNYSVVVSNNGINCVLVLYSTEGTNWTRVTSGVTLTIEWFEAV